MRNQRTLKSPVEFSGVGIHTGKEAKVRILPASVDQGVIFVRTDLPDAPHIPATLDYLGHWRDWARAPNGAGARPGLAVAVDRIFETYEIPRTLLEGFISGLESDVNLRQIDSHADFRAMKHRAGETLSEFVQCHNVGIGGQRHVSDFPHERLGMVVVEIELDESFDMGFFVHGIFIHVYKNGSR